MENESFFFSTEDQTFMISQSEGIGHYTMVTTHAHDHYELYYLLSGERHYFVKDKSFLVKSGDLVLINPRVLHKTVDSGLPNYKRIVIYFTNEFILAQNSIIKTLVTDVFSLNHCLIRLPQEKRNPIENMILKIVQESKIQQPGYDILLKANLMQLLVNIFRNAEYNLAQTLEIPSPKHNKVSKIVEYMNEHYMDCLTLAEISEMFLISPYHLTRIFKESTGFTFIEYLNTKRVQEAKVLLVETNLKVIDISQMVGFDSVVHFGRMFKKISGMTPIYYRKNNKL